MVQKSYEVAMIANKLLASIAPPNTRGIRSAIGERFVAGPLCRVLDEEEGA